ncbi:MAG: hypothetical protein Q9219_004038 [cf. Caloplaca sp. 3 TL-2023]
MTLDHPSKPPKAGPSPTATAAQWGRSPHIPSSVRPSTPGTPSKKQKDGRIGRVNTTTADKEDGVTPVKAFLSSNITPRSGSRKARVESATSTPRRTPESTTYTARPASMIEGRDWPSGGPKVAYGHGTRAEVLHPARAQSVVSDVQHPTRSTSGDNNKNGEPRAPNNLPKFFHVNDAKPNRSTRPQSQSPQLHPRLVGYGYSDSMNTSIVSSPAESPGPGQERPKFFHVDGTQSPTPPAPTLGDGTFPARPPLQTIFSSYQTTNSPLQRPPSPLKEEVVPISRKSSLSKPSPRRHTRLVSNGSNEIRAPDALGKVQSNSLRRSSLSDPARNTSQPQSPAKASFGNVSSRRSSLAMSTSDRTSIPGLLPESTYTDPSPTEPFITASPAISALESPNEPVAGQSKLDHLNELAANARRERKVLDLEISNSSLLAINRTLEAEMRKQKAELRHLRRLRFSGRFPSSTRSASSRFSIPSVGDDISSTSSADEDGLDDDRFSNISSGTSDDTSFPDSLSFSPTLRNSSTAAAKSRQSRSHKLDMSAQRALLLDSQKLNQALKRCLGRTDELIVDGKKALNYKVDTSNLAVIGPKVLTPDEHHEELDIRRGLLSPGLDVHMQSPWERTVEAGTSLDDSSPGNRERSMSEMFDDRLQARPGDEEQIPLPTSQPSDVDALLEGLETGTATATALSDNTALTSTETLLLDQSGTPNNIEIPYEDPGIDTGSETPLSEDSKPPTDLTHEIRRSSKGSIDRPIASQESVLDSADGKARPVNESFDTQSSSSENTESEEPKVSSPGKSLGDFLRMVGGSWGV